VAFYLHKKRDFLFRLDQHKLGLHSSKDEVNFFTELLQELTREDDALQVENKKIAQ